MAVFAFYPFTFLQIKQKPLEIKGFSLYHLSDSMVVQEMGLSSGLIESSTGAFSRFI